jgi:hypothetical protein
VLCAPGRGQTIFMDGRIERLALRLIEEEPSLKNVVESARFSLRSAR